MPRCIARRGLALLTLLAAISLPAAGATAQNFPIGFYDGVFDGPSSGQWLHRAAAVGANVVVIDIGWVGVAPNTPTKPAGFKAADPASPDYDFSAADRSVKQATADGLKVVLEFTGAPQWAEGPDMPADATPGSWKPNDHDIEQYSEALAKRYSGHFRDPSDPGRKLPRVWGFQLWNEPNLPLYLAPQWAGGHAVSPVIYRGMLNAFYKGVKSIDPHALVITAGTGPFGDPAPVGPRMMPALFWRVALCVKEVGPLGKHLRATHCKDPAHFDVLDHHPYSVGAPTTTALNADDVSIPDMWKLTDILRVAEHAGTALPRIHHQVWVTETGYNTAPPNPKGIPVAEDARWLEETLELLWQQGVSVVTWDLIVDQPPDPTYFTTNQSGIYYLDGKPKPALIAFRFPLVASRHNGLINIWGRAPASGRVRIEIRDGNNWVTAKSLDVHIGSTFITHVPDTQRTSVRGVIDGIRSLPWPLG